MSPSRSVQRRWSIRAIFVKDQEALQRQKVNSSPMNGVADQVSAKSPPWEAVQWLSPRPKHRTRNNGQSSFPHLGGAALYEPLSKPDGKWVARETHYVESPLVKAGLTGPPLHLHRLQDEFFKVEQGVLGVVRNGVDHAITKSDGVFHIPAGARHRFWAHKTTTEDLIFTVWLDPCNEDDHILDVNFLRNLSGYVDDCLKVGLQPSVFQIILFTDNASSLLCPPFLNWMPTWMLFWAHRGLARFAESVLGYEKAYPEYSTTK